MISQKGDHLCEFRLLETYAGDPAIPKYFKFFCVRCLHIQKVTPKDGE
jgi:hypothetical protein